MEKQVPRIGGRASRPLRAGFTFIEAIIAISVIGISLGALMTLNGQQLRMVKMARDTNAATLYQQERVEQLRQLRWPDLTDSDFIANTYMRNRPLSRAALDQIRESVTISAYPVATQGSRPLLVNQADNGVTTIDSAQDGYALSNERLVRVNLVLKWKAADGRQLERTTVTLISDSGITRNSLPAMGNVSGGASDAFEELPTTDTGVSTGSGSGNSGSSGNNGNSGTPHSSQGNTANPNGQDRPNNGNGGGSNSGNGSNG